MRINPGVYYDMPEDQYHARYPGLVTNSLLSKIDKSGAHYLAAIRRKFKTTPALAFGKAYHASVFEPERFRTEFVVQPKFTGKGSVAARNAWKEEHADRSVITQSDMHTITGMQGAIRDHAGARGVMDHPGHSEVSLVWRDPKTGLECRARPDRWIPETRTIVDLKSARDASPEGFARSIYKYGYHVQDALYTKGADLLKLNPRRFVFVAQEKVPPYLVGVYELDFESRQVGGWDRETLTEKVWECSKAQSWPGYTDNEPDGVMSLRLPRWAFMDDDDSNDGVTMTIHREDAA